MTPSSRAVASGVGLGVDAENETGATRLYDRVGMRVAFRVNAFRKDLG